MRFTERKKKNLIPPVHALTVGRRDADRLRYPSTGGGVQCSSKWKKQLKGDEKA